MIMCFREPGVSVFVCLLQKHEAMRYRVHINMSVNDAWRKAHIWIVH